MPDRINQAFEEAISDAADEDQRATLEDAKRVFEIMLTIDSASNRQTVIAVLERFDALIDPIDAIAERRVIPFPFRSPRA
jgi:hypothetical protein